MLKRALEQDMRKKQASGYVARSVAPGVASRLGAQGASQSKVVTPERGANVNMQVPTGQPVVPTSIPNGLAVEESVTVHIDLTGQGNTLTKERIILFDEGNYFSAANGIASKYPAGTGAAASAQLQFQEKMNYHVLNTRDQISSELEVSNFNDPGNFDRDVRVIPLTDRKARFDRETALEFYAYHGLHIILTFWMIGRARD